MKIYFDTSGWNSLRNHSYRDDIVKTLIRDHECFISVINIWEFAMTKNPTDRVDLVELAAHLTRIGNSEKFRLLASEPEILMASLESFLSGDLSCEIRLADSPIASKHLFPIGYDGWSVDAGNKYGRHSDDSVGNCDAGKASAWDSHDLFLCHRRFRRDVDQSAGDQFTIRQG